MNHAQEHLAQATRHIAELTVQIFGADEQVYRRGPGDEGLFGPEMCER